MSRLNKIKNYVTQDNLFEFSLLSLSFPCELSSKNDIRANQEKEGERGRRKKYNIREKKQEYKAEK